MNRPPPHLDDMLLLDEAAAWLRLKPRILATKTKGRNPPIPAFRINARLIRFHPRTIIAKLARDAGVAPDVIAASFGISGDKKL